MRARWPHWLIVIWKRWSKLLSILRCSRIYSDSHTSFCAFIMLILFLFYPLMSGAPSALLLNHQLGVPLSAEPHMSLLKLPHYITMAQVAAAVHRVMGDLLLHRASISRRFPYANSSYDQLPILCDCSFYTLQLALEGFRILFLLFFSYKVLTMDDKSLWKYSLGDSVTVASDIQYPARGWGCLEVWAPLFKWYLWHFVPAEATFFAKCRLSDTRDGPRYARWSSPGPVVPATHTADDLR